MTANVINKVKLMLFVSSLIFPKYPGHYFPTYIYFIYCQIHIQKFFFRAKPLPNKLIQKVISKSKYFKNVDENNTVIISNQYLEILGVPEFIKICLKTESNSKNTERIVRVVGTVATKYEIFLNECLLFNINESIDLSEVKISLIKAGNVLTATEIDISLVNTNYDIPNIVTDALIKNYFKTPRLLYKHDLITINLKKYGPEFYYTNNKLNEVKFVYFKCNAIHYKENCNVTSASLCVIGETTIKQSANVQNFVAPLLKDVRPFGIENLVEYDKCLLDKCPFGLDEYFCNLEKAIKPFLNKDKIKLKPIFMLQGGKGVGKNAIVSALACKLGLHLYEIASGDVVATAYAQTETKIRNIFFKTKLCSPCILAINNFENFGKNNEGQHDTRIMDFFKNELNSLFKNNSLPVILICISNASEIPAELSRAFLEIFDIKAPSREERTKLLEWILLGKNYESSQNVDEIAGKTHGFLFEDLKALVYYAKINLIKENTDSPTKNCLRETDFQKALDFMQSSYSHSLGAPKIPKVQWEDVGGLNDLKHEIIRTINLPLQHPELLRISGLKRCGILLYGPPGTGKTLVAKAVATECNLCFLSVKGPELLNMYVGQSERNVREVFEKARQASPCIIFFDELDSLAPNRGASGDSGGVMDRVVSQLLAEMDGLNQSATIFIIGATNRPDLIDPALLRPGRFDKLLYVGPCTEPDSKLGVLKALTRKFRLAEDVDLEKVVKICPRNITGADFYGLCSNAWITSVRNLINKIENGDVEDPEILTHADVVVSMEDFHNGIKDLKPSIRPEDLIYFENLKRQLSGNK